MRALLSFCVPFEKGRRIKWRIFPILTILKITHIIWRFKMCAKLGGNVFSNWEAKDIFLTEIFNSVTFLPDNVQYEKVNNVHFSPDKKTL